MVSKSKIVGNVTLSVLLLSSFAWAGEKPLNDVEGDGETQNVPYDVSATTFDGSMVPIDGAEARDGFRVMRLPGISLAVKDCAIYGLMSQPGATELNDDELVDAILGRNKKIKIKKHFAAFFQIPGLGSWIQRVANGDSGTSIIRAEKRVKSAVGKVRTFRIPTNTPIKYMSNFLASNQSEKAIIDGGIMATLVQPSSSAMNHQVFIANELTKSAVLFNRSIDATGNVSCAAHGVENSLNIATRAKQILDAFRKVSYFVSK